MTTQFETDFHSTNIRAFGYDSDLSALTVVFHESTYHYNDVPRHVFNMFKVADSKGVFFAKGVRPFYKGVKVAHVSIG